jgi:hypothetical protein
MTLDGDANDLPAAPQAEDDNLAFDETSIHSSTDSGECALHGSWDSLNHNHMYNHMNPPPPPQFGNNCQPRKHSMAARLHAPMRKMIQAINYAICIGIHHIVWALRSTTEQMPALVIIHTLSGCGFWGVLFFRLFR